LLVLFDALLLHRPGAVLLPLELRLAGDLEAFRLLLLAALGDELRGSLELGGVGAQLPRGVEGGGRVVPVLRLQGLLEILHLLVEVRIAGLGRSRRRFGDRLLGRRLHRVRGFGDLDGFRSLLDQDGNLLLLAPLEDEEAGQEENQQGDRGERPALGILRGGRVVHEGSLRHGAGKEKVRIGYLGIFQVLMDARMKSATFWCFLYMPSSPWSTIMYRF